MEINFSTNADLEVECKVDKDFAFLLLNPSNQR